ncbi:hypothetical protein [Anaeromicropila populeti]|nr:hypothetical protein [Anaeromicropila populeti]
MFQIIRLKQKELEPIKLGFLKVEVNQILLKQVNMLEIYLKMKL